ncbi:MAG: hypothetical protein GTO53_07205 [Planctomycetales bacterium]|nr:hypothetical protein [Planctomycetales bacterium]NIM08924.1 hypothetical protein [Planctomycetales bacterium]NIN08394.1 hypothetical protein [Planctomycetales bacterium]NIN77522.1 hypothetical protein [Planctomycetales bacterium]NIO34694.1 hypothetical protein [Planctomycetales bacterium]
MLQAQVLQASLLQAQVLQSEVPQGALLPPVALRLWRCRDVRCCRDLRMWLITRGVFLVRCGEQVKTS